MQIEATNLDALKDELAAISGDWPTDLPVFGGEEIDAEQVWSWDADRVLVGTCAGDLEIMERDSEDRWW